ncbi:MAG: glycosyltransferase [Candidatus Azobacteroides sp.]|nr:glycosyltransferase [Candidatus Azobacteroides sp.]
MKSDIAIVIPVYKGAFLEETIDSIMNQTDQDFHLYIGDDASDDDIESIIKSYGIVPNLTYLRFPENVGYNSPSLHWNRCLDMIHGESWVWLFSDDDLMDPLCIENFKKTLLINPDAKLFKYNSSKFVEDQIVKENVFPIQMTTIDFLNIKLNYTSESYAVEYIFHNSLIERTGKFSVFPLSWCSDDLFWIRASLYSQIVTIPDAIVYWRSSNKNISGRQDTVETCRMKMDACILFVESLKTLNILKLDSRIEYWLFHWISVQFHYLKDEFTQEESSNYLAKMLTLLPVASFEFTKTQILINVFQTKMPKIPKIIHYCWLSEDQYPPHVLSCIESWKKAMPDYELIRWDTRRFRIDSVPFVKEACENKKWAFACDYIRLYALYYYGGIYLDSDVYVYKSFDPFLYHDVFSSVEFHFKLFKESISRVEGGYKTEGVGIEAAVIGSVPEHPWIKASLNYYKNKHFTNTLEYMNSMILSGILAIIAEKNFGFKFEPTFQVLKNGIYLYPPDVFSRNCANNIIKYSSHLCAHSWHPDHIN